MYVWSYNQKYCCLDMTSILGQGQQCFCQWQMSISVHSGSKIILMICKIVKVHTVTSFLMILIFFTMGKLFFFFLDGEYYTTKQNKVVCIISEGTNSV